MELKVIFLEIVYLDLYSDKVWGFSIFSFCTPPGDIYGRPLLIITLKHSKVRKRVNFDDNSGDDDGNDNDDDDYENENENNL